MSLLVSLRRETHARELGAHEEVVLAYDELRSSDGRTLLARHLHNRWFVEGGDQYPMLEIVGPLTVTTVSGQSRTMGPYENLTMFDGVAYVEKRVFAFTDVQQGDWYMHDVGAHWPAMKITFHRTGP
jgi:hypothetical protein